MAPRTPKIRLLRDKRRALDDQIVKVEAELSKLKEEAREFEIAERVLLSLGGDDEDDGQEIHTTIAPAVAHALAGDVGPPLVLNGSPATAHVSRKPPGVPSTPDMILLALKEMTSPSASKTKAPLEIMEFIKERWWPSVTSRDISPVVWRMANEKRLLKDDDAGGYRLPPVVAVVGKGG